jgi:hypothetical protein
MWKEDGNKLEIFKYFKILAAFVKLWVNLGLLLIKREYV